MRIIKKNSILIFLPILTICLFFGFSKNSKAAITFGSEQVFKTTLVNYTDISSATINLSYVVYNDNSGNGYAQVCFTTGACQDEKSFGNASTIPAIQMQVVALTNEYFVVVYRNTTTGYGVALVGYRDKSGITFGTPVNFNGASTQLPHVDKLSSNKFVVTYEHSDGDGYARIGTTSGTTVSFPSAAVSYRNPSFQANQNVVATLIDDSKFVVAWEDTPGNDGYARIGTVSGTTPSFSGGETDYRFESGAAQYMSIDRLYDDKFVVAYKNTNGYAIIGDVSGSAITYGSSYEFNNANTDYTDVAAFDEYTFNVAYRDNGNSGYGTSITGYVTNDVISYGAETVYNSGSSLYNSITYRMGSSQKFKVAYRDIGNSNYGTLILGEEDAPGGPTVPEFPSWVIKILISSFGFTVVIFIGIYIKKKIIGSKKN